MCLAVPVKIVELGEHSMARGTMQDVEVEFSVELLDNPAVGMYAIVHAGVAIELLDEEEAKKTIALIEEAVGNGSVQRLS
jgi:hydrogenase expression/formation protein HypC